MYVREFGLVIVARANQQTLKGFLVLPYSAAACSKLAIIETRFR